MQSNQPHKMSEVLGELMARNGFARVQAAEAWRGAWQQAAGEELAAVSRVAGVRRGVLEVVVAGSALLQELTYRKAQLLADLAELLPEERIADLRFRVGPVT